MILKMKNPDNLISSAFFEENIIFNLFINLNNKNDKLRDIEYILNEKTSVIEKIKFTIKGENYIELISETNEDIEILNRNMFGRQDSDQIWLIYPMDNHLIL
jgi:hypothetical protein